MIYIVLIALTALIALMFYMWREAHKNAVIKTELALDGFPNLFDGTKLFFISDVHKRTISKEIIDQVKGKVDLVIIGGDLTEKNVPFERVEENIRLLREVAPTYFVWGNNDYEADFRRLDAMFLERGVKVLANTAVSFENENEKLILLGVDDVSHRRDRIDLALNDSEEGFRILVSHDPKIIYKLSDNDGISLVLSGHTHGGQIRLFGFGIREKGGIKQIGKRILFVSNGYGTTRVPFRLGAPAQTHLIILKSKNLI